MPKPKSNKKIEVLLVRCMYLDTYLLKNISIDNSIFNGTTNTISIKFC